jgi:NAD-dependent deacetylase
MNLTKDGLRDMLKGADHILVFTGAGASADSGIPTFRGSAGSWWTGCLGLPIMATIGTGVGWRHAPWICWQLCNRFFRIPILHAPPNACHFALAALEKTDGKWVRIVTQNVDGLHQRGGTPVGCVAEVHGTIRQICCASCRYPHESEEEDWPETRPCVVCGSTRIRPSVTLFQETMPYEQIMRAAAFCQEFEEDAAKATAVVLCIGTSGAVPTVLPMLGALQDAGFRIVYVDLNPSDKMLRYASHVVCETAGAAFAASE